MLEKLRKDIWRELGVFMDEANRKHGISSASLLLSGGIRDFVMRRGKMVRPLLFLISYMGYAKKRSSPGRRLLRAALAIELLHDFLLAHDDVIDKSALRRGKPTLHRLFNSRLRVPAQSSLGEGLAIVGGDIIFALAIEALLSADSAPGRKERALTELIKATVATGSGEFIDVTNGEKKINEISLRDVFLTYDLKTAKYTFVGPLVMGAVLAGAGEKEIKKLSELGIRLGRAFQVQDDLLDMFSSAEKLGKPTLSDLGESKKTLLVWKAYTSLPPEGKKALKRALEKEHKSYKDLIGVRKLIKISGADVYCEGIVTKLLLESSAILRSLGMNSPEKALVAKLIKGLFESSKSA